MKKIKNIYIIDFLGENGVYPVKDDGTFAYYKATPQLFSLLDKYFIKHACIPNRR